MPHTPAGTAGLRPGDIIEQVGGQRVFSQGQQTAALSAVETPQLGTTVSLSLQRPSDGSRFTVALQPQSLVVPVVTARLLPGAIGYLRLYSFSSNAAAQAFAAIKGLQAANALKGLVLDLRGKPGGDEGQAVQIISAFTHRQVVAYKVDGTGKRIPLGTDDTIALLHTPLVVLTDGGSASSSELVAGAVSDLHLGLVVGSKTAGVLASAYFYSLSDGSALEITQFHILGALGEKVEGVGIAPNQQAAATAADLSGGDDPASDRAVRDLEGAASTTLRH